MKVFYIIYVLYCIFLIFFFYDDYKYPVCPYCGDNLKSKRIKRNLIRCEIHGLVELNSKNKK